MNKNIKLQANKKYKLQNGLIVTMLSSNLPYYKFKALICSPCNPVIGYYEVYSEDGTAYHNDCDVIEEIFY
jgi:hypothetical protein